MKAEVRVVESICHEALSRQIALLMNNGWKLQGNMCVVVMPESNQISYAQRLTTPTNTIYYHQMMIKIRT
jgi:hypothetical protein